MVMSLVCPNIDFIKFLFCIYWVRGFCILQNHFFPSFLYFPPSWYIKMEIDFPPRLMIIIVPFHWFFFLLKGERTVPVYVENDRSTNRKFLFFLFSIIRKIYGGHAPEKVKSLVTFFHDNFWKRRPIYQKRFPLLFFFFVFWQTKMSAYYFN